MREDQMLLVKDLKMLFGGIVALNDVSFEVKKNSITALIGPNGAGKTTVFNCITGFYRPTSGAISLNSGKGTEGVVELGALLGKNWAQILSSIGDLPSSVYFKFFGGTHQIVNRGIARTFQNIRLFREMTVYENLLVAQHASLNRNILSGVLGTPSYRKSEKNALEKANFWLEKLDLADVGNHLAGSLPYGKSRKLEIVRAMCTDPRLICLDEPAAGLNPTETAELSRSIEMLRDEFNMTVLLIEHDMGMVMDISDYVVVLDHGERIAMDKPAAIRDNPAVIEAYLGSDAAEATEELG